MRHVLIIILAITFPALAAAQSQVAVDEDSVAFPSDSLTLWQQVRPHIPRLAVSVASSTAMRTGIVAGMKHWIHETRPDGSSRNSMPSRHAVWAYGIGTTIGTNLVRYSPWWAIGSHIVASGVGFQRVLAHRHYPGDVLAGAGIGIGTSLLSHTISSAIFKSHISPGPSYKWISDFTSDLTFSTGASFPLQKTFGEIELGTALISHLNYGYSFADHWAFTVGANIHSAPLKSHYTFLGVLSTVGIDVGARYSRELGHSPMDVSIGATIGAHCTFAPKKIDVGRLAPETAIDLRLSYHLTDRFNLGAMIGYRVTSLRLDSERRTLSGIDAAFITVARF